MTDTDQPGMAALPAWLVNAAALAWRLLVIAALAAVACLAVSTLWTISAAIAISVIVGAAFAPLVLGLRQRGHSRNVAAAVGWVLAMAVVCGVPILLMLVILPNVGALLGSLRAGLEELGAQLADSGFPAVAEVVSRSVVSAITDTTGAAVGGIVSAAAQVVSVVILAVFLTFFFLRDGDRAWSWIFQATADDKRELIGQAGDLALRRIGGYVRGMTVLAAIVAVTNWLFMTLLGVPLAVPLAILAFVAGYVPYVGGIAATIITLCVSLAALGTAPTLLLLVAMAVRTVLVGAFVRPVIYSHTMRVNPALVLVAIAVGAELGGVLGLIAAVPLTAAGLAVLRAAVAIIEPETAEPLPALVPAWIDRLAQVSWRALVAMGLIAVFVAIAILVPMAVTAVVLGLLLAASLAPAVAGLVRRGRSRGRAAVLAVGTATAAIVALVALSVVWLVAQAGDLGGTVVAGARSANDSAGGTLGLLVSAVGDGSRHVLATIADLIDASAGLLTTLLLSVLLAFFLLRDGPGLWRATVARIVPGARREVGEAGTRAVEVLGGYIVGTAAVSLVGAASQFAIMVVLGLPLALPVFVLSFFLGFIPYIGSLISTGIAFLIAVAVGSTLDVAVMAAFTLLFNIVQGNIVSPVVYGRTVHLHPAVVLLAIPAAATVAGIVGMFLIVPALGVVAATWRLVLTALADRGEKALAFDDAASLEDLAASPPFEAPAL